MNNEIGIKILDLLYKKWFKDYSNGISFQTFISKLSYTENEIYQTLEILLSNWIVEKNQIGWYVITHSGIDLYEETLF
jgi:hypothetical protein